MQIKSYWRYETGQWSDEADNYINRKFSDIKEKILNVTLNTTKYSDDCYGPVIRFHGGPTGFESYYLKEFLDDYLHKPFEDFVICGGTINSWAQCWVKMKDFNEILEVFKDATT